MRLSRSRSTFEPKEPPISELFPSFGFVPYVLCGVAAVLGFVFNEKLRHWPQTIETVVHEVGHSLASIANGGTLPLRITFQRKAEAEVFHVMTTDSWLSKVASSFGGYLAPILLGPTLIVLTLATTFRTSKLLFILIGIYAVLAMIFTFFPVARVLLTLAFNVGLVVLCIVPPEELGGGETPAPPVAMILVGAVWVLLFFGSWSHLFTVWRGESLRSLAVFLVSTAVVAALFFFPVIAAPACFGLGVFLTVSGWATIFRHRHYGGDFEILSGSLGGSPMLWFVLFCMSIPIAYAVLARLLWLHVSF